ncbi:urease accessory protein UreE [Beggiatoa leptomitoformis]|uniref:Urease accessory protein UreE n=1 Tax=Beggiatoa leptomitoformis TaxID=288004 RepID=A0A2N9YJH4_9GAMM|nr:urease accessory protein UreE [Beggiatoa leptomitoformis]ALG69297.1 urease accessory protein UreE [Beggiatoa leptomitoformis]AUI70515.1 urease accessory protein UreE [Beggiatoa leptomitoformis]
MLKVFERLTHPQPATVTLSLSFDSRQKSRFCTQLADGTAALLDLPRGYILRGGDCLKAEDGRIILVQAALETVTHVQIVDPLLLARICYHLGNRHIALQIDAQWVRYQPDHVLDEMLQHFGLSISTLDAPFEPEGGAYQHVHA